MEFLERSARLRDCLNRGWIRGERGSRPKVALKWVLDRFFDPATRVFPSSSRAEPDGGENKEEPRTHR